MLLILFFVDLELAFFEILRILVHLLIIFLTFLSGLIAAVPVSVEASEDDGDHHCEEHAAIENGDQDDTAMDVIIILDWEKREKHKYKVAKIADDTFNGKHLATNIAFQTLSIKSINHRSL